MYQHLRSRPLSEIKLIEQKASKWLIDNYSLKKTDPDKYNRARAKYHALVQVMNWRAEFEIARSRFGR